MTKLNYGDSLTLMAEIDAEIDEEKKRRGNRYGIDKKGLKRFKSGSVRTTDADEHRFDLVSPFGLFRLAKIYAEGAKKYGDRNWELGQPFGEVLNHAERHLQMWKKGDRSEDHLAKVAWGMFAIMHYEETLPAERREHERYKVKNLKGILTKNEEEPESA